MHRFAIALIAALPMPPQALAYDCSMYRSIHTAALKGLPEMPAQIPEDAQCSITSLESGPRLLCIWQWDEQPELLFYRLATEMVACLPGAALKLGKDEAEDDPTVWVTAGEVLFDLNQIKPDSGLIVSMFAYKP